MTTLEILEQRLVQLETAAADIKVEPRLRDIGRVLHVGDGIAGVSGLAGARAQELLQFPNGVTGMAFNVDESEIGCVLLGDDDGIGAGDSVSCTGEVARVPVSNELLGRVIDPAGVPLDGGPPIAPERFDPIECEAPAILSRAPVVRPLATGVKTVDAMVPIGRGQRELIIGDRSTGKTTIAIDAIMNQGESGVLCVYVAIGQRAATVARFIEALRSRGAMTHTVVVVADADSAPGLRFIAPYAGCAISEFFMAQGRDTLIVYDDLTKHAQTYREISLLLRRPPGREAYPGDVFFIHSRLLERATQLDEEHGGGSQTALPIIETQAQNISAYVPTNLISITDGQVYLSPELFQSGVLPAIDVGLSVSRVGGKTQIPAMKRIAQSMRLAYTQFIELEQFTKFGTSLEPDTRAALEKGRRIRELLKQPPHKPLSLGLQVAVMHMADSDALLTVPVDRVRDYETAFVEAVLDRLGDLPARLEAGEEPSAEEISKLHEIAVDVANAYATKDESHDAGTSGTPEEAR